MYDALFQTIRESMSATTWSRGVQLARGGSVVGVSDGGDELELRIKPRLPGEPSPAVTLYPEDEDWSCECKSREDACAHVAASIIALRKAKNEGKSLFDGGASGEESFHLGYRLYEEQKSLALTRMLVPNGPGEERPLADSLIAAQRHQTIVASPQDLEVQAQFGSFQQGVLPSDRLTKILEALTDAPDLTFDGKPVAVGTPSPGLAVLVEETGEGFRLRLAEDPGVRRTFKNRAFMREAEVCALTSHGLSEKEFRQLKTGRLFSRSEEGTLAGSILPRLEKSLPVIKKVGGLNQREDLEARIELRTQREGDGLHVTPWLVYGDPAVARVDGEKLTLLRGKSAPVRKLRREQQLRGWLKTELGMDTGNPVIREGEEALHLASQIRDARPGQRSLSVSGPGLDQFYLAHGLTPRLETRAGGEFTMWFEAEGGGGKAAGRAEPENVLKAWSAESPLVPLVDGGFAPVPTKWLQTHGRLLRDLLEARKEQPRDGGRVLLGDLARLAESLNEPPPPDYEGLADVLGDFEKLGSPELPSDLGITLRDYQDRGVAWMQLLQRARLGALLADDMGLGKTLQALATVKDRTLVVAPRSVLHNWRAEAQKARPDLTLSTYHGPDRTLEDVDLTLTTYAILRLDVEELSRIHWNTVILDESQAIKNPSSQVSRAAYRLNGEFKLALTGTPVENRLEDLWSQFHFINPGLLGGRQFFHENYVVPVGQGDEGAAEFLRTRVAPFILRRKKSEVVKELPPRTDVTLHCALRDDEREVYRTLAAATRNDITKQLGGGESPLQLLEALLRLRQAACDPALLPGTGETFGKKTSSKIRLLLGTLEEAASEGHRSLVFSQWTSLLDRIEPVLGEANLDFVRLDGSTRDRQGVVEAFQDESGPPVMLISLRAGGTGLNLTAADHVFLMDPWWNPAVEDQAADRAHRIGQERPVLVHRLVAEDTVEERILSLQEAKRALADAAVGDATRAQSLTREELLGLLEV